MLSCGRVILFVLSLLLWVGGGGTARASAVEPAGRVYTVPVTVINTFSQPLQEKDTVANVLVPYQMDDEGTLTLTVSGMTHVTGRLIIKREHLPEELKFLCGDNETVAVISHRPGDPVTHYSTGQDQIISIPYNRLEPTPPGRTLQFIDCQEAPLPRERFEIQVSDHSLGMNTTLPLRSDGTAQYPGLIAPPEPARGMPSFIPPRVTNLTMRDRETSVTYVLQLHDAGNTITTRVILPLTIDDPTSPTVWASATVKNSDGSPLGGVEVNLSQVPPMAPYSTWGIDARPQNPESVFVRGLMTNALGNFPVALSPRLHDSKLADSNTLAVTVTAPDVDVFSRNSFPLPAGRHTDIVLPARITVPFVGLDETGKPIEFQPPSGYRSGHGGHGTKYRFDIFRVDDAGETGEQSGMFYQEQDTSGTEFLLKGLPVPGRYMVKYGDVYYGPADASKDTQKLEFPINPNDGVVKGRALDEAGKPLPDALIVYVKNLYENRKKITDPGAVVKKLKTLDEAAGLAHLRTITDDVLDYRVTDADGAYRFPLKRRDPDGSTRGYLALAEDRIGAYHHDEVNSSTPLYDDVEIADIYLPTTTTITGIVHAPAEIPDRAHRGKTLPMPPGQQYTVGIRSPRGWFGQGYNQVEWQYITSSERCEFGKPFRYGVPVGTTISVYATPRDEKIKLSLEIWTLPPLAAGETRETTASTLRALQPYTLHLQYEDGSPGSGIEVNTLYGDMQHIQGNAYRQPQTDAAGEVALWGDEGLAPALNLREPYSPRPGGVYQRPRYQHIKIQKLDTGTSIPKLTLTLDPEIWGSSPEVKP